MSRLGVNIDHVATLRQARGEEYPSIEQAAKLSLEAGADQITIHLREDRRHIQDSDLPIVQKVTSQAGKLYNLEMGCHDEILDIGLETHPDWICLVPEKREEKTTEGGLNISNPEVYAKLDRFIQKIAQKTQNKTKVSLFIEANIDEIDLVKNLRADAVEIHTGSYAIDFNQNKDIQSYIDQFQTYRQKLNEICPDMGFHAGHGLTRESLLPLVEANLFEEYNIGHWIVCEAVFQGIGTVVKDLSELLKSTR